MPSKPNMSTASIKQQSPLIEIGKEEKAKAAPQVLAAIPSPIEETTPPNDNTPAPKKHTSDLTLEKKRLLDDISHHYAQGDLTGFLALFNDDRHNEATTKKISRDYKQLFEITEMRRIHFSHFEWDDAENKSIKGTGKFKADVWIQKKKDPITTEGIVKLDLVQEDGQLFINNINHIPK